MANRIMGLIAKLYKETDKVAESIVQLEKRVDATNVKSEEKN
jgi:hypothetical protein